MHQSNLQEVWLFLHPFLQSYKLIYIPLRPYKSPMEKLTLLTTQPDGEVPRKRRILPYCEVIDWDPAHPVELILGRVGQNDSGWKLTIRTPSIDGECSSEKNEMSSDIAAFEAP